MATHAPSCLAASSIFVLTHHHLTSSSHLSCNIMNLLESPFTNLDVWCDWNGDTTAPVEVTVSVEVGDAAEIPLDNHDTD